MKNKMFIEPEELFNNALKNHEAVYDASAWEHMKSLLDEDELKPLLIIPPKSNKSNKPLILFIMTLISALSIAAWFFFNPADETMKSKIDLHSENGIENTAKSEHSYNESRSENITSSSESIVKTPAETVPSKKNENSKYREAGNPSASLFHSFESNETVAANSVKDTVKTFVQNGKTYKLFVRKIWVPEEYEYIEKSGTGVINDGFFGIHFTAQRHRFSDSMNAGFNLQFMSGNRINNEHIGVYAGLDWGMQFYGRGKKSNVVLNNTSQDSGFTRLRTYSMDFLGRMHVEYAKFPVVPYFNVMAGPRIYSTGQTVASYLELKETESSTTHNAHTSVSMLYGFGVGARIKISKVVSLDARYEWINGSKVKLVDMNASSFNGLNYNLVYNTVTPRLEQFKVGILFNISEREYDKKLVKEGYFKEYAYDSVEINPADSNRIFIPCPCVPCPQSTTNTNQNRPLEPYGTDEQRTNRTSPSSSGSGRGSFPGIKPSSKPTEIQR